MSEKICRIPGFGYISVETSGTVTNNNHTINEDEDETFPKNATSINESKVKEAVKIMQSKYKTMANALVAAHKSKAIESVRSSEGKTITGLQKLFLVFLFLCTSVSILPWLIVWWIFIAGNKNKLQQASRLVEIEIPSTMENYNNTTDEDLKPHLIRLFKKQFKKARKILDKMSDVTDLAESASALKASKYYAAALEFNAKIANK